MSALMLLAAMQAGSAATAIVFVRWWAQADWSLGPRRRSQAPAAGLAGAVCVLVLTPTSWAPTWVSWGWLAVSTAVYAGLPVYRACEWRAAWVYLRKRHGRVT